MGRAPCCDKANVKRGPWSPEEDALLKLYIEKNGIGGNWISLPQKAGLRRCGKSCRLRWLNYLRPNIKHGGFTEEEDNIICTIYSQMGSRWSLIASQLPGRTDNDVKNYWNTKLKKKLLTGKASCLPINANTTKIATDNTTTNSSPSLSCDDPKDTTTTTHVFNYPNFSSDYHHSLSQTTATLSAILSDIAYEHAIPSSTSQALDLDPFLSFSAAASTIMDDMPREFGSSISSSQGDSTVSDSWSLPMHSTAAAGILLGSDHQFSLSCDFAVNNNGLMFQENYN